jgi:c-di-GMP-binding flagellar brake protein YcgR
MAAPTDIRFSPRRTNGAQEQPRTGSKPSMSMEPSKGALTTSAPFRVVSDGVADFKDRRRRRRAKLQPMYTTVSMRVLSRRGSPLDGHVLDISETGMSVEVDEQVGIGQAVTLEFTVAGMGRVHHEQWPTLIAAAEVVRIDDLADFPKGPYRTALRFVRISTMAQAQIARFVATQPAAV